MAKGWYIGDSSNKARKVKKIYIGDANGKARKVKKIYIGDANGKARLCWSGNIATLVGTSSSYFHVSTDLQTWTNVTNITGMYSLKTNYGNERFVLMTSNTASTGNNICVSEDGLNWTARSFPHMFSRLNFMRGKFYIYIANSNRMMYSENGMDWTSTEVTGQKSSSLTCSVYGQGIYVTIYQFRGHIYSSTDTKTLKLNYSDADYNMRDVTYGNGKFLVVGDNSFIWYSSNGTSWTRVLSRYNSTYYNFDRVAYGNGLFVGTCSNGKYIARTTDCINWYFVQTPSAAYDIVYTGEKFYVTGSGGYCAYSTDGETWTAINSTNNFTYTLTYSTNGGGKYEYTD